MGQKNAAHNNVELKSLTTTKFT